MGRMLAVCIRVHLEITVPREVDIIPSRYASLGYYEARGNEDL